MKNNICRILSLVIGLALMAVGFSVVAAAEAGRARRRQKAEVYGALSDAVGYFGDMAGDLALAVAEDIPLPALVSLRHHADLAAAALDRVPLSGEGGRALRRFAAVCGEVGGTMAEGLARGNFRAPDYGLLMRLRDCAAELTETVLPAAVSPREGKVDDGMLADCLARLGRVYYDGAASDVWVPEGYALLQKGDRLDGADALSAAEKILPGAYLTPAGNSKDGERFCFAAENVCLSVSAVGGKLLSLICDRQVRGKGVQIEETAAQAAAEDAVSAHIGTPMDLISFAAGEGCYYFTFAPRGEDLLCLSERITVGIDGVTGKLCLWDAENYYRYRTPMRVLPAHMLTPEEAAERYGGGTAATLCTAVRADGRELYCYRIGEGDAALYLNAVTGRVEEIL